MDISDVAAIEALERVAGASQDSYNELYLKHNAINNAEFPLVSVDIDSSDGIDCYEQHFYDSYKRYEAQQGLGEAGGARLGFTVESRPGGQAEGRLGLGPHLLAALQSDPSLANLCTTAEVAGILAAKAMLKYHVSNCSCFIGSASRRLHLDICYTNSAHPRVGAAPAGQPGAQGVGEGGGVPVGAGGGGGGGGERAGRGLQYQCSHRLQHSPHSTCRPVATLRPAVTGYREEDGVAGLHQAGGEIPLGVADGPVRPALRHRRSHRPAGDRAEAAGAGIYKHRAQKRILISLSHKHLLCRWSWLGWADIS